MKNKLVSGFVALPDTLKAGVAAVVLYVVSVVLTNVILLVPFLAFLEAFKVPLASALGAALITWVENILPDAYPEASLLAVQLALAILAAYGIGVTLAAQGALPSLLGL
jgi:hypothetical protein